MSQVLEHKDDQKPTPWGIWPTIGFSCVIGIVYVFVQAIVVALFIVAARLRDANLDISTFANSLESNGLCLAVATCAAAPFTIGLTILFARIRQSITVREYLGLHKVGWKDLSKWSLAVLLFVACHDTLIFSLRRPIVPEFMIAAYKTAYFAPLLWFAFVIVASPVEEILFRGFLFKGIECSKLGRPGAVIITSLAWALMHLQYDIYAIAGLFAGGLLLGFARLRSNSIYPPIIMHALQNIVATIEVVVVLKMSGSGC